MYDLPMSAELEGRRYSIHTDFRDILEILVRLDGEEDVQAAIYVCLHLFYHDFAEVPPHLYEQAYEAMAAFIQCGEKGPARTAAKLIDWEQDAGLIAAEVNRIAGREVRAAEPLHWHTFMGYFGCIGEGQLANVVAIRQKLGQGKKLSDWEREYYRNNRDRVRFTRRDTPQQQAQRERLLERLRGGRHEDQA